MTDYADEAADRIVVLIRDVGYLKAKDGIAAIVREACEKRVAEAIAVAIEAAVEWTCKYYQKREDAPLSWDAGFPSIKASALLSILPTFDAQAALAERDERVWKAAIEAAAKRALRKPEAI